MNDMALKIVKTYVLKVTLGSNIAAYFRASNIESQIQGILDSRNNKLAFWPQLEKNLSSVVCEQIRRRPTCTSTQSDQCLCYSFIEKYHI